MEMNTIEMETEREKERKREREKERKREREKERRYTNFIDYCCYELIAREVLKMVLFEDGTF